MGAQKVSAQFRGENYDSVDFKMAKALVLNKIHKELGLDKCERFYCAAAPIGKETVQFFVSLGIPLAETYGMSETSGPHSLGLPNWNRIGSIGELNEFNRSKVINNNNDDGCGELAIYGRHVFMGYMNNESKTQEAFDEDGW